MQCLMPLFTKFQNDDDDDDDDEKKETTDLL